MSCLSSEVVMLSSGISKEQAVRVRATRVTKNSFFMSFLFFRCDVFSPSPVSLCCQVSF